MIQCYLDGPDTSAAFAQSFARHLRQQLAARKLHAQLALEGGLGAGKSHLARAMLREWGVQGPIPSPTYSLLEPYADADPAAAHMDWYRLSDPLELEMLDWEGICREMPVVLVEWASRLPEMAQQMDLLCELQARGEGRQLAVTPLSPTGKYLLEGFDPEHEKDPPGQ